MEESVLVYQPVRSIRASGNALFDKEIQAFRIESFTIRALVIEKSDSFQDVRGLRVSKV